MSCLQVATVCGIYARKHGCVNVYMPGDVAATDWQIAKPEMNCILFTNRTLHAAIYVGHLSETTRVWIKKYRGHF